MYRRAFDISLDDDPDVVIMPLTGVDVVTLAGRFQCGVHHIGTKKVGARKVAWWCSQVHTGPSMALIYRVYDRHKRSLTVVRIDI